MFAHRPTARSRRALYNASSCVPSRRRHTILPGDWSSDVCSSDPGHFKDPLIAPGVRDAIYYGRRLGMAAAGAVDNPTWLDNQLYEWELQRDRDCIISYHFGLRLSLTHPVSPVELEMFKNIQPNFTKARQLGDSFARTQSAESLLSYPHLIHWTAKAAVNPAYPKMEVA